MLKTLIVLSHLTVSICELSCCCYNYKVTTEEYWYQLGTLVSKYAGWMDSLAYNHLV